MTPGVDQNHTPTFDTRGLLCQVAGIVGSGQGADRYRLNQTALFSVYLILAKLVQASDPVELSGRCCDCTGTFNRIMSTSTLFLLSVDGQLWGEYGATTAHDAENRAHHSLTKNHHWRPGQEPAYTSSSWRTLPLINCPTSFGVLDARVYPQVEACISRHLANWRAEVLAKTLMDQTSPAKSSTWPRL